MSEYVEAAKEGFVKRAKGGYVRHNPYFGKKGSAWRHGYEVADEVVEKEKREKASLPPTKKYTKELLRRLQ